MEFFGDPALRKQAANALRSCVRDTDIQGWCEEGLAVGIIFTEIGTTDRASLSGILIGKIRGALSSQFQSDAIAQAAFRFFLFPEDWDKEEDGKTSASLYPETVVRPLSHSAKRVIDVAGALAAIVGGLPLFVLIACAVKLTSKGPVLFRQERVGQFGRRFTFLKFRSMRVGNDPREHQDYVRKLIQGTDAAELKGEGGVFKITNDPRVTPVGRFLRKTSLDELPQFFNVLRGDMSLVGPRPPIPYEVDFYDIWHRRRLLAVRPGITGLWQVTKRSQTTFDDMVRLDLQYARNWSLWLDLKILAQTPWAVVAGAGAY